MVEKKKVREYAKAEDDDAELGKDLTQPHAGPGANARVGFEEGDVADDPQIGRQLSRCHAQLQPPAKKVGF